MSIVLDVSSWQERVDEWIPAKGGKIKTGKKIVTWKGYIEIDQAFPDAKSRQAAFAALDSGYKSKFKALGSNPSKEQIREMQDWHARELRILSGRDPFDAKPVITKSKKLDIIKLAEQFGIEPGSPGWENTIIALVEKDAHSQGEELDEG